MLVEVQRARSLWLWDCLDWAGGPGTGWWPCVGLVALCRAATSRNLLARLALTPAQLSRRKLGLSLVSVPAGPAGLDPPPSTTSQGQALLHSSVPVSGTGSAWHCLTLGLSTSLEPFPSLQRGFRVKDLLSHGQPPQDPSTIAMTPMAMEAPSAASAQPGDAQSSLASPPVPGCPWS